MWFSRSCLALVGCTLVAALQAEAQSINQEGLAYFGVRPCRILDTRAGMTPRGDGPLVKGQPYAFDVSGGAAAACGIPASATIAMLNFVAVGAAGAGHLTVWPWDNTTPPPNASVINYAAGSTVANAVAVSLCDAATATGHTCTSDLLAKAAVSNTHLVVDVVGYFAAPDRQWGQGRANAIVYGISDQLCRNGDVLFGLSSHMVQWDGAAAACPVGTWVCTSAERGLAACDTDRPDAPCEVRECDGSCLPFPSNYHFGWVADAELFNVGAGAGSFEAGGASSAPTCAAAPVWCCSLSKQP